MLSDKSNAEAIVRRVLAENRATYRSRTVIYQRGIEAWYEKVCREVVEAIRQADAEAIDRVVQERYVESKDGIKCGDYKDGIDAVREALALSEKEQR